MRHIPNFITSLNIIAGSISVVFALENNLLLASLFIFIGAIFDFLDGMTARLLKAYSEIGKQLDSLADMISFGLAPSVIVFSLILKSFNIDNFSFDLPIYQIFISLSAFLIAVFSGLRLAKFNIDTRQTISFIGLPTPANAIFIASFPLILAFNENTIFSSIINNIYFLTAIVFTQSYLLVSKIEMFSLKFKTLNFKENKLRFVFLSISIIMFILLKYVSIPLIIIIYIILSFVNSYFVKRKQY